MCMCLFGFFFFVPLEKLVTITPVAERLAVEMSLTALSTKVRPNRGSNPDLLHTRQTPCPYATAAIISCVGFLIV